MPKVELHVHLEGSIQPETLLKLATATMLRFRPIQSMGCGAWYKFTNFAHFIEVYSLISSLCPHSGRYRADHARFLAGRPPSTSLQ